MPLPLTRLPSLVIPASARDFFLHRPSASDRREQFLHLLTGQVSSLRRLCALGVSAVKGSYRDGGLRFRAATVTERLRFPGGALTNFVKNFLQA